jgi:DNA-binding beta-propeller fold protein YncE
MRLRLLVVPLLVAACGNDLPPVGECMAPPGGGAPVVEAVHLTDQDTFFDDLAYSPLLGKVVAAPERTDTAYLIDPATMAVTALPVGGDIASADAAADLVFAAQRPFTIHILDPIAGEVGAGTSSGGVDYLRVSPDGTELWLTEPGDARIEVLSIVRETPPRLAPLATIPTPGAPEGLHFAGDRAYTQSGGRVIAIDIATRAVVGNWSTGCAGSHGFPMADAARGLAIGGCNGDGGGAVIDTTTGDVVSGFEAGGGEAVLAYAEALGHFYLRGDPSETLAILGVCGDGAMALLGTAAIPSYGHGMAADELGHVWVADPDHGGVVRVTDPFPAMP